MQGLWRYAGAVGITLVLLLALQIFWSESIVTDQNASGVKIVSLAPNLTAIVFALGLGDSLVGVTTYCDDPPAARSKTRVGDFIQPNLEVIMTLKPDLILIQASESSRSTQRLRDLGQTVVELGSPFSIGEVYRLIASVGKTLHKTDEARLLIESMRDKVEKVRERARALPVRPSIYIENDVPTWTIGGPTFTSEAIAICGADNIFGDLDHHAPRVSEETIIRRNPKLILSFVAEADDILSRPGWGSIDAIRNRRIIDQFEHRLLVRGNHRLADGMQSFQQILFRQFGVSESR